MEKICIKGMSKSCCGMKEMIILKSYFKTDPSLNMIYKATRDGFKASDFHSKCDNKMKVLVIIKAKNYIFGGFTNQGWNLKLVRFNFVNCNASFIFSLSNPHNKPSIFLPYEVTTVCYQRSSGPSFGQDISILDESNLKQYNFSNLGHTFISKKKKKIYSKFHS